MDVLVTGAAGFIGFHLCQRLLAAGHHVVGIDNLNPYYSVQLKKDRLAILQTLSSEQNASEEGAFSFLPVDLADDSALEALFAAHPFTHVVNLAAQAGVRYSLENPKAYVQSNLVGFGNLLECCRHAAHLEHLVFASSSSVYGLNTRMPFSVRHNVDHPVSLYAATKKSNELMAHSYSHLYHLPATGLRFFTVYGPWGRPDMALFLFTKAILEGTPINVFNEGRMRRDFTYIDDIIEGVVRVMARPAQPDPLWNGGDPNPGSSPAPWRIYNIGNNNTVELNEFIDTLEATLGRACKRILLPMQPGDVEATWADVEDLTAATGFFPHTPLKKGIEAFVAWYRAYYSPAHVSNSV